MENNTRKPLSEEEMACLADGTGSPAQIREWQARLAENRLQREEYAELKTGARESHGIVDEYIILQLADRYFPPAAESRIWVRLKERILEAVESPGWAIPALHFRDSTGGGDGILNFSKRLENLTIDFQLVRVKKDALTLTVSVKDMVSENAPAMKITLARNGRILNSRHLQQSRACFREVAPGEYNISLSSSEGEDLQVNLRIDS